MAVLNEPLENIHLKRHGMNTNLTYVAFDAVGIVDHEHSNFPYFRQIERWAQQYPSRFRFVNTEDIDFTSEHDDYVDSNLKMALLDKMATADNLLVMASSQNNTESPILNWQISKCVNRFHLPVIVAYAEHSIVTEKTVDDFFPHLPNKVRKYLTRDSAPMAHIPLNKDKLERALVAFSVRERTFPWHSKTIF